MSSCPISATTRMGAVSIDSGKSCKGRQSLALKFINPNMPLKRFSEVCVAGVNRQNLVVRVLW